MRVSPSEAKPRYNRPVSNTTPRLLLAAACLAAVAAPAAAWTPASQQAIASEAARLAPPDLYRQIARNRAAYLQGVVDGFGERDPLAHTKHADGTGRLDGAITAAVDNAVNSIAAHRPFNEICYRLGIVSHFLADANNPLNAAEDDSQEARYYADFLNYLESVEPRIKLVFYGFRADFDGRRDLPALIDESLDRGRGFYPLVGREYRRVDFASGLGAFDDQSTAFGIASLAYSHALSDIAEALRYIWLEAGGIDTRKRIPVRGQQVVRLPRNSVRSEADPKARPR